MHDPRVPETFEGWSILHQMFRVRWAEWGALPTAERDTRAEEAARALAEMRRGAEGTTVPVTMLGHKGDLMLIHFRRRFEDLQRLLARDARVLPQEALERFALFEVVEQDAHRDARAGEDERPALDIVRPRDR